MPAHKGCFDIAHVVHSVITDAQFEAESTGILIRFDRQPPVAGEETAALFGNAELVRWAVANGVRNAMRFSTPGQIVSIRLAYAAQASPGYGLGLAASTICSAAQIGKCPGSVSIVIQRSSVNWSMPALPPKRP